MKIWITLKYTQLTKASIPEQMLIYYRFSQEWSFSVLKLREEASLEMLFVGPVLWITYAVGKVSVLKGRVSYILL